MKKAGNRLHLHLRVKQQLSTRMIVIVGACSAAMLIFLAMFLNIAHTSIIKANNIEIRQVEEQEFRNEMSLPVPLIKTESPAGPEIIFIRKIKQQVNHSEPNHE